MSSLLLLPHLPVASVLSLLPSSLRFYAFSKMQKTLGPLVQKVLRPPAGTPRRPTCIFYYILQGKLASNLKKPSFLIVFERPPSGPQEAPKRPTRGFPAATLPSGPQEVPKRPQEAPQEAPKRPPGGPQEAPRSPPRGPQEANQSVKQPITHPINASISQSLDQPSDPPANHPGPGGMRVHDYQAYSLPIPSLAIPSLSWSQLMNYGMIYESLWP